MAKQVEQVHDVVIRFAGDSGDGMQLTGGRFTSETAALGNDLATFPDFPAEIRAPAGSLPGVSGFQIHFSDHDILTPGDRPDVLVAMNPAALRTNLKDLPTGGSLILNRDAFTEKNLQKAGYTSNPLEDESLADFRLHAIPLTSMTVEALKGIEGVTSREAERSKNFFALGLMSWLYGRPTENTLEFIRTKFAKRPEIAEANRRAFNAGYNYGETSEDFLVQYEVQPASLAPGMYRQITGNQALAYGLIAASVKSGLRSSSARTRSRRLRGSSRSSRTTRSSASARSRPRTRSPRSVPRSARASAAGSACARQPVRASCSRRRRSGSA
jgi:2-oxoglutarate ferredoxin oxidoreductase subunit alpha